MPIPARLQPAPPSDERVREMCALCDAIERAINGKGDPSPLLSRWHAHAMRHCDPSEFTTYWKAIDQEDFVREVLFPRPKFMDDLQYDEARAVLESVAKAELPESEQFFFLEWLEAQFPNSNM